MGRPNFRYLDINNNVFTVEKLKVEFEPITKDTSFTGKYEGGKPAKGKLSQKQLDTINSKIDHIKDSKSLRTKKRSGQNAMLLLYLEESKKKILLTESADQKKIEAVLRKALGID